MCDARGLTQNTSKKVTLAERGKVDLGVRDDGGTGGDQGPTGTRGSEEGSNSSMRRSGRRPSSGPGTRVTSSTRCSFNTTGPFFISLKYLSSRPVIYV